MTFQCPDDGTDLKTDPATPGILYCPDCDYIREKFDEDAVIVVTDPNAVLPQAGGDRA